MTSLSVRKYLQNLKKKLKKKKKKKKMILPLHFFIPVDFLVKV